MDWTAQIDVYCERLGPGLWAEPLNAASNLAFLLAAAALAWRLRGSGMPYGAGLLALLAMIGLGSGLWHTLALGWTGLADVLPILLFVLLYLFAVCRQVWGFGRAAALALTVAFLPLAGLTAPLFARLPVLGDSAGYLPIWALIAAHAWLLHRSEPALARGFALGAALLALSLLARSLDGPLCAAIPSGTHVLWHLLNAAMLGWMIELLRRHHLARSVPPLRPGMHAR